VSLVPDITIHRKQAARDYQNPINASGSTLNSAPKCALETATDNSIDSAVPRVGNIMHKINVVSNRPDTRDLFHEPDVQNCAYPQFPPHKQRHLRIIGPEVMRSVSRRILATIFLTTTLVSTGTSAFTPHHLKQLKETNARVKCDLSAADLSDLELARAKINRSYPSGTNLSGTNLRRGA
jgi:hypothetical protein